VTDDDPNESYEVVPIEPGPHGPPEGWWTVKRNGLPVRHFPGKEKGSAVRDRSRIQSEPGRRKSVGEGKGEMTAEKQ
jgi:hypothetical protein